MVGKSSRIGRQSVQRRRVDFQEIGGTGGWLPMYSGHTAALVAPRPSDASRSMVRPPAAHRAPGIEIPPSPTRTIAAAKGQKNQGPDIIPARNAPAESRMLNKTTRLPCP